VQRTCSQPVTVCPLVNTMIEAFQVSDVRPGVGQGQGTDEKQVQPSPPQLDAHGAAAPGCVADAGGLNQGLLAHGTRGLAWEYTDFRYHSEAGLSEEDCAYNFRSPSPPLPTPPATRQPLQEIAAASVNARSPPRASPTQGGRVLKSDVVATHAAPASAVLGAAGFVKPVSLWHPAGPLFTRDDSTATDRLSPSRLSNPKATLKEKSSLDHGGSEAQDSHAHWQAVRSSPEDEPAILTCRALMTREVQSPVNATRATDAAALEDDELSRFLAGVQMARADLAEKLRALKEHPQNPLPCGTSSELPASVMPLLTPSGTSFETPKARGREKDAHDGSKTCPNLAFSCRRVQTACPA